MATYTLSSDCSCESYDDNDNLVPSNECFGCYDDDKALLVEALDSWIAELELSHIQLEGKGIGWRRNYDSFILDANSEELIKALQIRGDFRIEVEIPDEDADHDLNAKRYSHDEPMGASFYIVGLTTCDDPDCSGDCNFNFCENLPD